MTKITQEQINQYSSNWSAYDYTVSKAHLNNYGCVYLDEYNAPVDVEELEYLLNE